MRAADLFLWPEDLRARWRSPRSFTAIITLPAGELKAVRRRLQELDPRFIARLGAMPNLHFLRLLAAPPDERDGRGARILLNTVHDEPLAEHLDALARAVGDLLIEAFAGSDFRGEAADLPGFLRRRRVREDAFFIAAIGHTVPRVLAENKVREALGALVDRQDRAGASARFASAEARRLALRAEMLKDFPAALAAGPSPGATFLRLMDLAQKFIFFPLVGVLGRDMIEAVGRIRSRTSRAFAWAACGLWWLYGGIFSGLALAGVRLLELLEPDIIAPLPDEEKLQYLENAEDRVPRNELTVWFPVKKSWIGRVLLRVILFGSECGVRHFWTDGRLAGAQNIHYARLAQIDGGRAMVFMSDYEGSFDLYIDHFVGIGGHHRAVVPISSRLEGCPKTRWLYLQEKPPEFRRRWKDLIRLHQLKAAVWYCAYPFLSANDILANARVCAGLFAESLSEDEAREWLRLL